MSDLKKEINRLSNLKQNAKKDKSVLEKIAQINIWKKQADITSKFEDKDSKILGEQFFDNYLNNYEFVDYSDIQNVCDLVCHEVLKQQIQVQINKKVTDDSNSIIPEKTISSLQDTEKRIWELKEKVGISGVKEKDDLTALQELDKKFKLHIVHNRNEYSLYAPIPCKDCGSVNVEPVLIRRKCNRENFEILKHPFFSGRFYFNRRAIELVKANIITKEAYAWMFHTSVKYVDWCLTNEHKIIEIDGIEEKEIEEFINNTSYLKKESIPENIKQGK